MLKTCSSSITETPYFCSAYQYGKSHVLPFPSSITKIVASLELIHSDIWRSSPVNSIVGYRCYIHFLHDYTRYTWIYPLKFKSEAFSVFKQFKFLNTSIKCVQTDWDGEYRLFQNFLAQNGIQFLHPYLYTHQQNGKGERKHCHSVELGLTLSTQACNTPKETLGAK